MEKVIDLNSLTDELKLIDIAKTLSEYEDNQIVLLCTALTDEKLAMVLEHADENIQLKIISYLTNEKILKIFGYMQKDDIADILGMLKIYKRKELLNLMIEGDRKILTSLLGYKEDSAGGIMTTEFIIFKQDMTIKDTLKEIKKMAPKNELLDTLFISDNTRKVVGTVELRDVLINDNDTILADISSKNFISVEPEVDQEEVAAMFRKYDLTVLPVVNKKQIILGIITVDDVMDVMVEEQTEDILKMGGVAKEETLNSTFWDSVKLRLPWLIINLLTAFLAALTVKAFEGTIAKVVALSSTMSMVTGMGGNAGTQTVSIIIRNIAMGNIELKDALPQLKKEILLGLVNGLVIGIITGIVVGMIYQNVYLGIIILLAMVGNLIVSGIFGLLVPLVLQKLKVDPALSSSIFLTTATDVLGFFIFLSLANLFISCLV
ncbi:MAG: magnesium transporter [Clostridiales bacterium]|jgi:magnesium transporter|nr:magnesium transporter [Clostridiales bacterium]